jgi:hypothetical protein
MRVAGPQASLNRADHTGVSSGAAFALAAIILSLSARPAGGLTLVFAFGAATSVAVFSLLARSGSRRTPDPAGVVVAILWLARFYHTWPTKRRHHHLLYESVGKSRKRSCWSS